MTRTHAKKKALNPSASMSSGVRKPSPAFQVQTPKAEVSDIETQLHRANHLGHNFGEAVFSPTSIAQRIQPEAETEQQAPTQMQADAAGARAQQLPPSSGGSPLPNPIRSKFEGAFKTDFSDVRIHEGREADSIGAVAYTRGAHLHFAPGKYNPLSQSGQQLLGHELTHVVQQRAGQVAVPQGKGTPINNDSKLEKEADVQGAKAAQDKQVQVGGVGLGLQRKATPEMGQVLQCNEEERKPRFHMDASGVAHEHPNFLDNETKDSLKQKLKRKPEEHQALAKWNTNAAGRNQGLVHTLDYAYARPPKSGLEELEKNTVGQPTTAKDLKEKHGITDKQIKNLEKYTSKKEDGTEELLPASTRDEKGNVIRTDPVAKQQELENLKAAQDAYKANLSPQEKQNLKTDEKFQNIKEQVNEAEKKLGEETAYTVPREESKKGRIKQVEEASGNQPGSFKQDQGEIIGVTNALDQLTQNQTPEKETKGTGEETTLKNPEWVKDEHSWQKKSGVKVMDTARSQSHTTGNEKQSLRVEKWGPAQDKMKYSTVMGASTKDKEKKTPATKTGTNENKNKKKEEKK